VVAGTHRGRRIATPRGQGTRPTGDRVREATFNALGSLGVIGGVTVLDLFAGSGALGIEALSRGAEHCTFVETGRDARRVIQENLTTLGLIERATVLDTDALAYVGAAAAADVVMADPPYRFDRWHDLLTPLDAEIVVIESDRVIDVPPRWSTVRQKRYGSTVVLIARREPGQAQEQVPHTGDTATS